MAFSSFQEFIVMGGYGFFVWLAFGGTFLGLGLLVLRSVIARRHLEKACADHMRRQERLARRQQQERSR
ncbi:heme exporter protein CcmD [Pseudidiomarina aestuarii]|uniref:heme exporter protein CcmD n=1 Tax=Pseudidiomarina aestuarii TaxID=624146 RepID=UPI003A97A3A4